MRCVALWNSLPASVVEVEGLSSFKLGLDEAVGSSFFKVI